MPKRRNTSWSRNKKEKQIITTRLIEISLKVENCVYKHMPISVCEAEQYMREVSSYKVQCSGDERSLQVIEKLTRCMKAIILDHQEEGTGNPTMQNARNIADGGEQAGSNSPVYSLPDEDRTLTQIAEASPINVKVTNEDVEIINLSNIDEDDDLMPNDIGPTSYNAGSRITVEMDIHRGMSSLSLRDAGDSLEITSSDVNCSQSILNNFEGNQQVQQNEINVFQGTVDGGFTGNVADKGKTGNAGGNTAFGKIPNKNTISTTELNKFMITNNAQYKPTVCALTKTVQNKEPLKKVCTYNNLIMTSNQKESMNTITSQAFYAANNKIPVTQGQNWYDSNRTCTVNDSYQKFKDANTIQPANIYKVTNPITVTNNGNWNVNTPSRTLNASDKENQPSKVTANSKPVQNSRPITYSAADVEPEIPTVPKKKRGPRKKKIVDEKDIKPKNKRVYRGPKFNKENTPAYREKNKILPIYNENVINDLSWVENIRYVREIRVDENDPKLNLEESFWDNYYLPANWSENEFM